MLSSSWIVFLSARLGDKGLFSTGNILQIADVVRQVVLLLFFLCFESIVRLFLRRETSEVFCHFVLTIKTTQSRPQVFSINRSKIWQFCCTLDVIFHISQNSSKYGRQYLVMINYAQDFSQSETEKYFEWKIIVMTENLWEVMGSIMRFLWIRFRQYNEQFLSLNSQSLQN